MSRFAAFLALCEKNEKSKNEVGQKPKGFNPMDSRKRIQSVFLKNPLDKGENTNKGMKVITEEDNNRQVKEVVKEKEKQQENENANRNINVKNEQGGGINKVEFIKLKPIDKKKVDLVININTNNKDLQKEIQEKSHNDKKIKDEPKKEIEKIDIKKEEIKPITNKNKEEKKEIKTIEPKQKEEAKPNPIKKEEKKVVNTPKETIPIPEIKKTNPIREEKPKEEIPQHSKNEVHIKSNSFADRLKMFELNNAKKTNSKPSFNFVPKKVSFNPPQEERINVMIKTQEPKESTINNNPVETHNEIKKKVEEKKPIEIKPTFEHNKPIEQVKPKVVFEAKTPKAPIEEKKLKKEEHKEVLNHQQPKPIEIKKEENHKMIEKPKSIEQKKPIEIQNHKEVTPKPIENKKPIETHNSFNEPKQISSFKDRLNMFASNPKQSSFNNPKPSVKFTDNNHYKPINKVTIKEPSFIPKQEKPIIKDPPKETKKNPPINSFEEKRKMMSMRLMMVPGMGMMSHDPIHNRNNESSNETKVNTTEVFHNAVENIQNKPVRKVRRKTVAVGFKE